MTSTAGITIKQTPRVEPSEQGHRQPKPSTDFAQELRQHAPSREDAQASANDEKMDPHGEMTPGLPESNMSMELPLVARIDQTRGLSVDLLPETIQQAYATTQPVGMTEALLGARVFGWHALAQSYLSELAAFDAVPDGEPLPAEAKVSVVQVEAQAAWIASEKVSGANETPATLDAPEVPSAAESTSEVEGGADLIGGMDTNDPNLVAMASVDYWAERSLRFTRQLDGQVVAWLRDYHLDAAEAGQVVRLVLREARVKGFTLDRIVLNGREAWSSRGQV